MVVMYSVYEGKAAGIERGAANDPVEGRDQGAPEEFPVDVLLLPWVNDLRPVDAGRAEFPARPLQTHLFKLFILYSPRGYMNYYLEVFKKYAVFSGRARRAEYWYFCLFNLLAVIALVFIDAFIGGAMRGSSSTEAPVGLLTVIYYLAMIIPMIAVTVRRLHDVGKSGWWIFISLVPVVGGIWLFVLTVMDSTPGDNQYGPNPKMMKATPMAPIM